MPSANIASLLRSFSAESAKSGQSGLGRLTCQFGLFRRSEIKLCGAGELGLCFVILARMTVGQYTDERLWQNSLGAAELRALALCEAPPCLIGCLDKSGGRCER